jgi:hypothetical protein
MRFERSFCTAEKQRRYPFLIACVSSRSVTLWSSGPRMPGPKPTHCFFRTRTRGLPRPASSSSCSGGPHYRVVRSVVSVQYFGEGFDGGFATGESARLHGDGGIWLIAGTRLPNGKSCRVPCTSSGSLWRQVKSIDHVIIKRN